MKKMFSLFAVAALTVLVACGTDEQKNENTAQDTLGASTSEMSAPDTTQSMNSEPVPADAGNTPTATTEESH